MANSRSAEKRNRQALKRRAQNRAEVSKLRGQIKKLRSVVDEGNHEAAKAELQVAHSVIDKAAKRNVLRDNTASRYKSRLSKSVKRAASA